MTRLDIFNVNDDNITTCVNASPPEIADFIYKSGAKKTEIRDFIHPIHGPCIAYIHYKRCHTIDDLKVHF